MNLISRAVAQEGATTSGEMGTLCCVPLTEKYVVIMLPTNNKQPTTNIEPSGGTGRQRHGQNCRRYVDSVGAKRSSLS